MLDYHFTGDTLRDGRPIPAIGETLIHSEEIVWCESGLYASPKPHMALKYAPGPKLHLVSCEDVVQEDKDKFVCRRRTILKSFDATDLLRRYAADQALSVKHLWNIPGIVEDYLTNLDETKRSAAREVAWEAARAAAGAAREAAWKAARAAAGAAREAAWEAAITTTWNTAWNTANKDFDKRVDEAFTY